MRIGIGLMSIATLLNLVVSAKAAEPVVIRLWPDAPPTTQQWDADDHKRSPQDNPALIDISEVRHPSIAGFFPAGEAANRPAVIICPGGGYSFEAAVREGNRIAEKFNEQGVVAFVLKYRLPEFNPPKAGELPVPQQDLFRATQIVRSRAAEWHLDPAKIGIVGFSAGGHLAASGATLFDRASTLSQLAHADDPSKVSARPDFAILIYPVITFGEAAHKGSREHLLGKDAPKELIEQYSAERNVTANTPPLFILHAADDKVVPVANALMMAEAASKNAVPCTLVLLHSGGHGFGVGAPNTEAANWMENLFAWLRNRGVIAEAKTHQ